MSLVVVLPAAGSGSRIASKLPKQFLKFRNKELIAYTLEAFEQHPMVTEIIVATSKNYIPILNRIRTRYNISKLKTIVEGGKERQDSVYNALASLRLQSGDLVAVHDAARPLISKAILTSAFKTARVKGSAVVCVTGRDTLLRSGEGLFEYVDRKDVHYVQTPQVFRYENLFEAMKKAQETGLKFSDESSLMHHYGYPIELVEGSLLNFKVTTPSDVEILKGLFKK